MTPGAGAGTATGPRYRRVAVFPMLGLLGVMAVTTIAACSSQDGDTAAGVRVATTAAATGAQGVPGAPGPATPAVVAAAGLNSCPPTTSAPPVAGGLPDLELACLGAGPQVRLSGLRGTPLVVNVWAPWCGPCQSELPVLAQVAARAGQAVRFLGVDVQDPDPDGALKLLAAKGVRYPSVVDYSRATQPALRWTGPPMTVFVRSDGTIAYRQVGEITSADQLRGLLEQHLAVHLP